METLREDTAILENKIEDEVSDIETDLNDTSSLQGVQFSIVTDSFPEPRALQNLNEVFAKAISISEVPQEDQVVKRMSANDIAKELNSLQTKYGMSSEEYYRLWKSGNIPAKIRGMDKLKWAILWEVWEMQGEKHLIT